MLDAEEEDYFNADDDEEDPVVPVPRAGPEAIALALSNAPRRKRERAWAGITRQLASLAARPVSPLSSLLDYDDDDDLPSPSLAQAPRLGVALGADAAAAPPSPVLQHRQIEILPYEPPDGEGEAARERASAPERETELPSDPEDDLLEALVQNGLLKSAPSTPGKAEPPSEPPEPRLRDKRRRSDEDEEDSLLERLASKTRRLSKGGSAPAPAPSLLGLSDTPKGAAVVGPKTMEEASAPKRLKLKFSAARTVGTTPSSRTGGKGGENG